MAKRALHTYAKGPRSSTAYAEGYAAGEKQGALKRRMEYHTHEALDRTSLLAHLVQEWLVEHPSIEQNPHWLKRAKAAEETLSELYQLIGAKHL